MVRRSAIVRALERRRFLPLSSGVLNFMSSKSSEGTGSCRVTMAEILSSVAGEARGGIEAGDVVVDDGAGPVDLTRVDRADEVAVLAAQSAGRGIPIGDPL